MSPNVHSNLNEEQSNSQSWHAPQPPSPSTHSTSLTTLPLTLGVEQGSLKETHLSSSESGDHLATAVDNDKGTDGRLPASLEALDHREYSYQDHLDPWIPSPNAATMFQGAHGFYISGQPRFVNNFTMNEQSNQGGSRGFGNLARFVSFEALHDSSVQDFDRYVDQVIREKTLNQLQEWFGDPTVTTEQMIWLHGPPSIGKTAIALEIARQEKVVATFFFNRSDARRSDGNRLFTTLAWQLARSIPDIKKHIIHFMHEHPDLPKKRIEEQFEYLVVQPFAAMKKATSTERPSCLVVIIDGIDECADTGLQRRLLKVIGKATLERRVPLQFIVSSRPDAHIQDICNQFQCPVRCIDLAKFGPAEEIRKREKGIRKREDELKEEERKLKERVEEIGKKEKDIRKREDELKEEERKLKERVEEISKKEKDINKREDELKEEERKLKERVEEISKKEKDIRKRGDELKEEERKLKEKVEEISNKEKDIRKRGDELKEEERKLKERVEEIGKKGGEAKKREEEVGLKEDAVNVREVEAGRKEREILRREAEAKQMEARCKELAVKYPEEEAGRLEEKAHRREEEIKMKEEELNRREDEILHLAEEMRQKAEELERRELESRLEDERQQARLQGEEMGRQKENESNFKMKIEELKKKEDEVRRKEEEAKKMVKEASRKEGEAKRRQEKAQRLEEEARKKEEEAQRLVEETKRREEQARAKEDETRLKVEEAKLKEEEAAKKEEEARRREDKAKKKELVSLRKEREVHKKELEAKRNESEADAWPQIPCVWEEEARRREEETEKREEEIERREKEAQRKEDEAKKTEPVANKEREANKTEWETLPSGQEFAPGASSPANPFLDVEPSEEEKRQIKERTNQNIQLLYQDAEELFKRRMQKPQSDKQRARLERDFKWEMRMIRSLGAEKYHLQLEFERQRRKWAMSQPIDEQWKEILLRKQSKILGSSMPSGLNPGAALATDDVQHSDHMWANASIRPTTQPASDPAHVILQGTYYARQREEAQNRKERKDTSFVSSSATASAGPQRQRNVGSAWTSVSSAFDPLINPNPNPKLATMCAPHEIWRPNVTVEEETVGFPSLTIPNNWM